MSKLMRAGVCRYVRSPIWWISVAASIALGVFFGDMIGSSDTFEVSAFLILQIIFSILISLSVGREFSEGIIRNKLITGSKRWEIIFSESILGITACCILYLIFSVSLWLLCITVLSRAPLDIALCFFFGSALTTILSAVISVILVFVFSRRTIVTVFSLLLVLIMSYVSDEIYLALERPEYTIKTEIVHNEKTGKNEVVFGEYGPNTRYIDGIKRKLYILIDDIIPFGQMEEYCDIINVFIRMGDAPRTLDSEQKNALILQPICSVSFSVLLIAFGYITFCRRDLK